MKLKKMISILAMLMIVLVVGCKKNENPALRPNVTSTSPINNATSTVLNSSISATFSAGMDPLTITTSSFTLMQGTTAITGTVGSVDSTATFTPSANLTPGTIYTATITTVVKNNDGTNMGKTYTWNFTTGTIPDVTKPTVTLADPLNNAIGVAVNKLIVISFSEPMDKTTISSLTYTVKQGSVSVPGTITYTGTNATFTPTSNLQYSTVYSGVITTGAKDMAGNALASNFTFSFTTVVAPDLTLPMVNSTDPMNNAIDVAGNKVVAVTFSKAMDPLTITLAFTLKQGTTSVPAAVTYSGTTARLTPTNILSAGLVYTATISTGAKDLAGNQLAANLSWSFTTAVSGSGPAKVNLGTAGNYLILAKTAITNISTSAITGDLGLSPAATSYITGLSLTNATGYAFSAQVTGQIFAADMASPTGTNLTTAVENMITAYTDAAGRPTPDFLELGTGNLGGKTLTPGLYKWTTTVTMPSDVTISGGANDVWIFQISQNLLMSNGVHINLIGGAQAKNIFWQVAGQATLGTTSHFEGIILSQTGITLQTGATFKGRALAQTAVVLDGNTVILP